MEERGVRFWRWRAVGIEDGEEREEEERGTLLSWNWNSRGNRKRRRKGGSLILSTSLGNKLEKTEEER